MSETADAVGVHRVLEPSGVLPQAAWRLDADPRIRPDEVRLRVRRLNLDAASFTQLRDQHGGDGERVREDVAGIIATRGKMHNPVTGSGGMLIGVVEEVGPESPLGLHVGDRVATLVSLTLTPLRIEDGLCGWDGLSEQVPCDGTAILFRRSIVAILPEDLPEELAMSVNDVCGAPALTTRVVQGYVERGVRPTVAVLGGAGKSGSLSLVAARRAGAGRTLGVVPGEGEARLLREAGLADVVALADARDPVGLAEAVSGALGAPADLTIVCVTVPGCEHGAVLATAEGGTIIFFSMATSFTAAALGAEGLAADVTMLIGNGYARGHAALALDLLRTEPALRALFEARLAGEPA
ncbi:MAG: L-erythro-3,5-diaminohexanoate dehydrogenase [Candidatus Nanopelagicales bacterium]|jgi:L-erythro-3,5-diaminohexanoate dehydrogenase|nr:L-erythro-3,5-diaminohexanoate dehydrogenase [Candidatus Nanopelagicales bacterium]